ncbi:hypothetical protein PoB_006579500, partial [Plakobranchus ocellatus]
FQSFNSQFNATLQTIENKAKDFEEEMEKNKNKVENLLGEIRDMASEKGVSQQAVYFKQEAEIHEKGAKK